MKREKSYFSFLVKSSINLSMKGGKKITIFLNSPNFKVSSLRGNAHTFVFCFYSPRTGFSSPLFSSVFSYPLSFHFPIPPSLRDTQWRSFVGMPAVPPVCTCRPLGLSSITSLSFFSSFLWCCDVAFTAQPPLHFPASCPFVLVVCLSCALLPHPLPPPTYSLWHLFRLIAWLACVSLLSWMD